MQKRGENTGKIIPDKQPIKKARVVGTRISGAQAESLEALATASNMTESTYIRHVIQRAITEGWAFKLEMTAISWADAAFPSKPRGP
ncbi:hypothetical protein SQW19_05540 [Stenotrophomonas acidaminiphila]|uniref:hypothetical protein n=1 Tax=Stenotrophomonas acidaminiphila TaxID=128780 RepID=UPI002ABE40AC|nr:hypothetical protein [Stenotrophomonas acidaminiphila]WPU57053.1 hypothetical protein SQW19_05540 [Stenotrophomonas acidaminiphila]